MTSAYIHIPFCEQICFYCDFNKVFLKNQPVDEYIDALLEEAKMQFASFPCDKTETLYIGGGTPTSLTAQQLDMLCAGLRDIFPYHDGEFTVEVNPGDLDEDKLHVLQNYGVNRLSLGVQTFDDRLLKSIGRKHTANDVFATLNLIEKVSTIDNITIDLMYALPHQTKESWQDTITKTCQLDLPHIAMYSLILENKTRFANLARRGKLHRPSEDDEIWMFEYAKEQLLNHGLKQYELSNFSKPGFESQHNLMYWNDEEYYGIGAGASGYLQDIRFTNKGPIQHYLEDIHHHERPLLFTEKLTQKEKMEEYLFLGLRKIKGVAYDDFYQTFKQSLQEIYGTVISDLVKKQWLYDDGKYISLTEQGLLLGNEVFQAFLLD